MPELKPSVLKPNDNLIGMRGASTMAKAERYDKLRPGAGARISDEQKAERIDLMRFRDDNGIINRKRTRTAGSITVPNTANIWDENGKLKP